MEQLTWSPWSLQTSSRSSPYQCQTWAAAALLWLHQTGQHYLRLVTQLSQHPLELLAFQISHLNFWFLWLQWLESYWKLLPFFAPSLLSASQSFLQPSAEVSSLLNLFEATLLEVLYCCFAWSLFPVCLPLHRGILPVHLSWCHFPRKHSQEWQECFFPVSEGHSHSMGLFLFLLTRFLQENAHKWYRIGPTLSQN